MFSPDVMRYGGTYSGEVGRCLGDFPVVWPSHKIPIGPSDGPDFPVEMPERFGPPSRTVRPPIMTPPPSPELDQRTLPGWLRSLNQRDDVVALLAARLDLSYQPERRLAALGLVNAGFDAEATRDLLDRASQVGHSAS